MVSRTLEVHQQWHLSMDNTSNMIYKILQVYSIRELFAKKLITNERREEASLATVTNTKKIRDWGGGSLSEHGLLIFCHGPMDSSRICHCHCFMSMASKTSCCHFSGQGSYCSTHTLGQIFTNCLWHLLRHYSWPLPEANSTTVRDLTAPSVNSLLVHSRFQ